MRYFNLIVKSPRFCREMYRQVLFSVFLYVSGWANYAATDSRTELHRPHAPRKTLRWNRIPIRDQGSKTFRGGHRPNGPHRRNWPIVNHEIITEMSGEVVGNFEKKVKFLHYPRLGVYNRCLSSVLSFAGTVFRKWISDICQYWVSNLSFQLRTVEFLEILKANRCCLAHA